VTLRAGPLSTLALASVAILAVSSGCGDAPRESGTQMMGGESGYHDSALRCSAPSTPTGQTVAVSLADTGMTRMMGGTAPLGGQMKLAAEPAEVRAGQVTLVASNLGRRTHELVILPLGAGAQAGQLSAGPDGKVAEGGSVGEASKSCAGGPGAGITAGAVGWTTVTLTAGRYELVCNLPDHYADGMHQELTVI